MERLLIKGKKPDQVEEIDGDPFRYFLLAGWIVWTVIMQLTLLVRHHPPVPG